MAIEDKKVKDLPLLATSANDDLLIISDTSEPTDENKTKVQTKLNFLQEVYVAIALVSDALANYFTKTESDARYLQSYTETDPVFVASPAHGITAPDIANWNSKAPAGHTHTLNSLSERSYNSLTDRPTLPTNLSDLNKDITFDERYFTEAEVTNLLDDKADLDETGKVPLTQLPVYEIDKTEFGLLFPWNFDFSTLNKVFVRTLGVLTTINYYEVGTSNLLFTKVFNRTGSVLNSIVLTDVKNSKVYTKTFTRDGGGVLLSIAESIA